MAIPEIMAIPAFTRSRCRIRVIPTEDEIRIGSISSDVERKIDIRVPSVMILPAYKLEAAAENPH